MDTDSKMDVADWRDSLPIIPRAGARRYFLPPTVIGITGTLLLHALLIQSVSFLSRGPKPKPPEAQESASALAKSTPDADSLVLISLATMASASQPAEISSLPDLSKMKIKSPISVDPPAFLNFETLPLSEDPASNPIVSGTNGAELAQLFGIYTGQIQARIDRVWRRPRTPVSENAPGESFQCEAQIVQDGRGNVREILLPRCNGSVAWQHSLVLAIQQASPLPAPPSIKVFTQSITLKFVGLPYIQGASNEEYEIIPLARVD